MTAMTLPLRRPLVHRAALRLGGALTEWGARPAAQAVSYSERTARMEASREAAARTVPQLPR
ncbi:hypothetical protein [Leifsonia sp. AG29]|uniref:hypothetical protein n=1 Tax=Leifsonia sp. AG29 TaxID=2598860 RepID=UPI00131AAF3D|nr:hypothetical protein [Leifsonia sp. AG29]